MFSWQDALIAGAGVSLIAVLKEVPGRLFQAFLYYFTRKIVIYQDDTGYDHLLEWMADKIKSPKTLRMNLVDDLAKSTPGFGIHILCHKRSLMSVVRGLDREGMRPREYINVTIWTRKDAGVGELLSVLRRDSEFKIHIAHDGWFTKHDRPKRSISTVYSRWNNYLADQVSKFLSSKDWYQSNGVPWRRAFLFYGDPRTGKTSTVHALASEFNLQVFIIDPSGLGDRDFSTCINQVPPRSIILMEDLSPPQISKPDGKERGVSSSTLLNCIDGLAAPAGVLIFATTNHINQIPENLKQRFECLEFKPVELDRLNEAQREALSAGQNQYGGV